MLLRFNGYVTINCDSYELRAATRDVRTVMIDEVQKMPALLAPWHPSFPGVATRWACDGSGRRIESSVCMFSLVRSKSCLRRITEWIESLLKILTYGNVRWTIQSTRRRSSACHSGWYGICFSRSTWQSPRLSELFNQWFASTFGRGERIRGYVRTFC